MKLFGSLGGSSSSAPTESESDDALLGGLIDRTESVTDEEYIIEAIDVIREAGLITKVEIPAPEDEAKETDVVAGPAVLEKIEEVYGGGSNPLLPLGYDDSGGKITVTGIYLSDAFEHCLIAGSSGAAKSTVAQAIMVVFAYAGYGFFASFPKGSEDADDLIAALPEHRLDDVIIIDPTETAHTIPMNLLDVPEFDDPDDKDEEISERVGVTQAVLMQDYGDGFINVETVIEVTARAMMYSDKSCSFVDMFLLLNSQHRQEDFVEEVEDPLLADAMAEIAAMEDDEIRPVLKRLMSWVLDPTIRRIISHRESALDWREVIDEDKIVIMKLGVSNKPVKRLLTLLCWRQLTAAVQQRYNETGKQIPYAAFLDEFNDVASEKLNIQDNFARARSMGLALLVICQYPSQLPDQGDDSVQDAVLNNAKNAVALKMNDRESAKIMADKLRGISTDDIIHMPNYQCWTNVPTGGGERSDALRLKTIPPMPPLRTEDETDAVIEEILEREGVAPPSIAEIIEGVPFGDFSTDELLEIGEDGESLEFDESMRATVCKAVYDEAIRQEADDGWVRVDEAAPRIRRYLPGDAPLSTTAKLWGNLLDHVPESHLEREDRGNAQYLRCTDEGKTAIFASGAAQNSGGAAHRLLLRDAYKPLTELGFVTEIPDQSGENLPDAVCSLEDVDTLQFDPENESVKEIADRVSQFEDENPLLARLSDANDVYVEAESTTATTAPAQTLLNCKAAVESGHRCLFLARTEEVAERIWDVLAEDPAGMREYEKRQHRLYNANDDALSIGGAKMYRPAGPRETVWLYDETVDQYLLSDSSGTVRARFDSAEDIFDEPEKYPLAEGETADYDDWTPVKRPVPVGEWCDRDNWDILLVDDWAVYEEGEKIPLDELLEHESTVPEFNI